MKQTAVEWIIEQINNVKPHQFCSLETIKEWCEQAKEMERKERLKHQLFIGKVTEILGFDKTVELLKECNNEIL
jgi:hypothetical protein